jgi:hypothetical protein
MTTNEPLRIREHVDRLRASNGEPVAFFSALLELRDDSGLSAPHREVMQRLIAMEGLIWYMEAIAGAPVNRVAAAELAARYYAETGEAERKELAPRVIASIVQSAAPKKNWPAVRMATTSFDEVIKRLPKEDQGRIEAWMRLQVLIAETLRIAWEKWVNEYIGPAMAAPLDLSFLDPILADLGKEVIEGGVSFTIEPDAATALVSRVTVRAKNNLGRLSPALQDSIAAMLEGSKTAPERITPADVAHLQKLFPKEKSLARLPHKDFRRLAIERSGDNITIQLEGGDAVLELNVLEFGAVMSKALV